MQEDISPPIADLLSLWRASIGQKEHFPPPPDRLSAAELGRLAPTLRGLSAGFNSGGLRGEAYLGEEEKLAAYLLYFWPISYTQMRSILRQVKIQGQRALDVGSGPGPVVRALFDAGFREVWAADHIPAALEQSRKLNQRAGRLHTLSWDAEGEKTPVTAQVELITLGHSLNELWKERGDRVQRRASLLERLAQKLLPEGRILIMEPASHAVNQDMLLLRDTLLRRGFSVEAPCFFQGPCPALQARSACHAEQPWLAPALVRQLAQAARIDKSSLAFGWLLLRPPGAPAIATPADQLLRVTSEKMTNKAGRERVIVCGAQGRHSLSFPVAQRTEMPWRGEWERILRGSAVSVQGAQPRESGLGLDAKSSLKVL